MIRSALRTWLRNDCGDCFMNNRCVRASAFGFDQRKYFLLSRGYRLRETEKMLAGKERHAEISSQYEPMDVKEIMQGLRKGKKIFLSETAFCSKMFGLRGHPDLVELQLIEDKMNIRITDFKTSFYPDQIFQVVCYGLVFSDPLCDIIFEDSNGNRIGTNLYPRRPFTVDINLALKFSKTNQSLSWEFMNDSKLTAFGSGYRFALLRRANSFRRLHPMGIYFIEQLPYCKHCPQDYKKCSLWRICGKSIPVCPEKNRQRFFGRRKILIKNRRLK